MLKCRPLPLISLVAILSNSVAAECFNYPTGRGTTAWGNWFAISDGRLLTAAHNVNEAQKFKSSSGNVRVKHTDSIIDIALVECAKSGNVYVLADNDASVGDDVIILGSREDKNEVEQIAGKIESLYDGFSFKTRIKMKMSLGLSGSPVLKDGKVVGMLVAAPIGAVKGEIYDNRYGLMIPVSVIKEFLRLKGIK